MSPVVGALTLLLSAPPSTAPLGAVEASLHMGADALAGRLAHDRGYGASLGLSVMAWPEAWRAGGLLDDYHLGVGVIGGWTARMPTAASVSALDPFDVAPNGYLYGGLKAELLGERDRFTLRYTIGGTGEASSADRLYETLGEVGGWDHAAEGEVAQNVWLTWTRSWTEAMPLADGAHLVDLCTTAETALGERRVSQSASATLRLGLLRGPQPGTVRTGGPAGWWGGVEAYVYGTAGLELVASDTLIDGPFFNDRPHPYEVSARPFVPVGEIGLLLRPVRNLTFGFALELRGAEVDVPAGATAPPGHALGRLDLAVRF